MQTTWGFSGPGRFLFGRGAVQQIAPLARRGGWSRVLLVTDSTMVRIGHVDKVVQCLAEAGIDTAVFSEVEPEPAVETPLRAAASVAKSEDVQAIIALGGGSCLDVGKMTAVLLRFGGSPADYFGFDRVPGPILPLVAIPTTAGTGSEVSHSAVLTDHASAMKVSTLSPYLRPAFAVVDPSLTDSCPPQVSADSGIDALVHAIEGYTARDYRQMEGVAQEARAYEGSHPLGRLLAGEAIRMIDEHLVTAVHHGDSPAARDAMALAASYAGMAFSNCGVALVHALEYPLGALVHCSHGAGNGLLLPYVMQFNRAAAAERMDEVAVMLGATETSHDARIDWLIRRVIDLRSEIGIPHQLRELGVRAEHLEGIATKAAAIERLMTLNPRRASAADLLEILRQAL